MATDDGTWPEPPGETRAERLRWIVQHQQAGTVEGEFVDMTTANMLMTVHDFLTDTTMWERLPLSVLVDWAWKAVTPRGT